MLEFRVLLFSYFVSFYLFLSHCSPALLSAAQEIKEKREEDLMKLKRLLDQEQATKESLQQEARAKQAALSEQLNEQLDQVNRAK